MICNNCKNNIDENLNFCPHCGTAIQKETICTNCNNTIDKNLNFCPYCGTQTKEEKSEPEPIIIEENEPQPKLIIGVISALILGVLGLIIAMVMFKDKQKERESFLKGWIPTFVGCVILNILTFVIVLVASPYEINEILYGMTEFSY